MKKYFSKKGSKILIYLLKGFLSIFITAGLIYAIDLGIGLESGQPITKSIWDKLTTQLETNTDKNTAQDISITNLVSVNNTQNANITANTNKNTAQDTNIISNTTKNNSQDISISSVTAKANTNATDIVNLLSEIEVLKTQISNLQTSSGNITFAGGGYQNYTGSTENGCSSRRGNMELQNNVCTCPSGYNKVRSNAQYYLCVQ